MIMLPKHALAGVSTASFFRSRIPPIDLRIAPKLHGWSLMFHRPASGGGAPSPPKKAGYPERLLVYHAGTGKTVFVGSVKLTTLFLFSFSCVLIAPGFWYADDWPDWMAGAVIVAGALPMGFVAFTTSPFVTYIHLRLPAFARRSNEILRRYSRNLPPNAVLDITTMRFSGRPRVTAVKVSELKEGRSRLGVANLQRIEIAGPRHQGRPWWKPKRISEFYIAEGEGRASEMGIWENVKGCIGRYGVKPVFRSPDHQGLVNSRGS